MGVGACAALGRSRPPLGRGHELSQGLPGTVGACAALGRSRHLLSAAQAPTIPGSTRESSCPRPRGGRDLPSAAQAPAVSSSQGGRPPWELEIAGACAALGRSRPPLGRGHDLCPGASGYLATWGRAELPLSRGLIARRPFRALRIEKKVFFVFFNENYAKSVAKPRKQSKSLKNTPPAPPKSKNM